MRPTSEVESIRFSLRSSTTSLSLPQRGYCCSLLQSNESQPIAVGDFDGLDKAKMLRPKRNHLFNFFHEQNGRNFFSRHLTLTLSMQSRVAPAITASPSAPGE